MKRMVIQLQVGSVLQSDLIEIEESLEYRVPIMRALNRPKSIFKPLLPTIERPEIEHMVFKDSGHSTRIGMQTVHIFQYERVDKF